MGCHRTRDLKPKTSPGNITQKYIKTYYWKFKESKKLRCKKIHPTHHFASPHPWGRRSTTLHDAPESVSAKSPFFAGNLPKNPPESAGLRGSGGGFSGSHHKDTPAVSFLPEKPTVKNTWGCLDGLGGTKFGSMRVLTCWDLIHLEIDFKKFILESLCMSISLKSMLHKKKYANMQNRFQYVM